eukprot:CAMPEP_0195581468 /NCGR_PEP_ID=MMETSP0814-20130614/20326_1 /TAXON_ID=97485 /ORGANISM="Prymnesium parvum, Strain Texoma1" /LENGTH=162 /DNA_ID=CAMNT_0040718823 /DNA_START=53 /DNA_END=539 /DNA_ORIENTATION=+
MMDEEAVRDEGSVVGRNGSCWRVKFADGEYAFERKALSFVSRGAVGGSGAPARGARRTGPIDDTDEEDDAAATPARVVSSDEDGYGAGECDHDAARPSRPVQDGVHPTSEWRRGDDEYGIDEHARHLDPLGGPNASRSMLQGCKQSMLLHTCHLLAANQFVK